MISLSGVFIAEKDTHSIGKDIEWGTKHCYFHPIKTIVFLFVLKFPKPLYSYICTQVN